MARSFAAFSLALAGIWLLAGPGWALIAGAILVFALWPRGADAPVVTWARRAAAASRAMVARVLSAPRRATAVGGMTGGLALVPAGLMLQAGPGIGLAAGGALLIGLSLLAGQGA